MTSISEIKAKADELRKRGFDLGAKVGSEQDAHSGGRMQSYRNGHIYWHPNTGAHEVHGGILQKYLAEGGPGPHPQTGRRHFGYPTSDEMRKHHDPRFPVGEFEFGEIAFVAGSGGGVPLHGEFRKKAKWELGFALTEPLEKAGGEVVYFERGCLYRGPATKNEIITCLLAPPPIGRTRFVDPRDSQSMTFGGFAHWTQIPKAVLDSIISNRPALFSELWKSRLWVEPVTKPGAARECIPVQMGAVRFQEGRRASDVFLTVSIAPNGPVRPKGRSLYNLVLNPTNDTSYTIAPHAFYTRALWDTFGFIHATDIHVARRIDGFHTKLRELGQANRDLADAHTHFVNFNNNFRELIRYANHLHDVGMIDFIIATGDLVDYALEDSDDSSPNNYVFFEQLVRGQAPSQDGPINEELRVPIFTTFGNHDYRMHPYALYAKVDVPVSKDKDIEQYAPYNLTKMEAHALQGGKPKVSLATAQRMVKVDTFNQQHTYSYYRSRINPEMSYTIELGPHRIVMLDTRSDAGLPSGMDWQHLAALLIDRATGNLSEDTESVLAGSPNLLGLLDDDIRLLKGALSGAHELGVVVVGMHAPPLNIEGSEFNHYFRETEHATAPARETYAFLLRRLDLGFLASRPQLYVQVVKAIYGLTDDKLSEDIWEELIRKVDKEVGKNVWPRTGTPYFKAGDTEQFLDAGVAVGSNALNFLKLCAGVGAARPVDLVLCGHGHDRVEYRFKWHRDARTFSFFMDFYTENPIRYYPSKRVSTDGPVHVIVKKNADPNAVPRMRRDNRVSPPLEYRVLDVPPYADPLNETSNPRVWWEKHRPLVAETAALGPIDRNQRAKPGVQPSATFQGFRVVLVGANGIRKSHYVSLPELRKSKFVLPWEKSPPTDPRVAPQGPLRLTRTERRSRS